ncbi:hypothetical protein, partial [Aeromonas veronii]|uniref:hypothetical protein n=1 Tax=Aeromonas veronii TaxID=654 RepID=UPI001A7E51E6
ERGKINMMHSDSRVKEPVCLATTSLPDPCLSTYLSPRFREEPKLMAIPFCAGLARSSRCAKAGELITPFPAVTLILW